MTKSIQDGDGGAGLSQNASTAAASKVSLATSASQPASTPARRLLNLQGVGAKFGVGDRKAHDLTLQPWFPLAYVLSARVRRWDEREIDEALASRAPRRIEPVEPTHLVEARARRDKAASGGVA